MKYSISPDRTRLTLTADAANRAALRELPEEGEGNIDMERTMIEFLEPLTCNSELEWIPEGTTGDLTSAPMLGLLGEPEWREQHTDGDGTVLIGVDSRSRRVNVTPVLERWAWMDYAVRSLLVELRDTGSAALIGGPL